MPFPAPENYQTWQDFARALVVSLSSEDPAVPSYNQLPSADVIIPEPPDPIPGDGYPPAPIEPVWYDPITAKMYLGNDQWDPPTAPDLFQINTAGLLDAAVSTAKLANGAVDSAKLADLAVEANKLANSSVTATKIANLAVGTAAIQLLAVGTAQIADASILTAKIGDAQIVTAKIADLAVNDAKIANLAVTSAKIANLAVGAAHIQDLAVTRAKIALLAVGSAQIEDAAITNVKIGNVIQSNSWNPATKTGWNIDKTGVISGQGINIYDGSGNLVFGAGGTVDWSRVVNVNMFLQAVGAGIIGLYDPEQGLIDAVALSDAAVAAMAYVNNLNASNINTYIANGAIGNALIANAAIGSAQIADAAIISAKIAFGQILSAHIADAQITQAKIGAAAIGEAQIINGAIVNAKIANAAIDAVKIQDGAISNAKIGNLQVDTAKIADLTVGTEKVVPQAVTQVVTYINGGNATINATGAAYTPLVVGGSTVQTTLTKTTDNQQAVINFATTYRSLSYGTNLYAQMAFACQRNDGVYIHSGVAYGLLNSLGGLAMFNAPFVDPSPNPGNNTYTIMIRVTPDTIAVGLPSIVGSMIRR